jgi:excisionase family DNA binding protein
MAKLSPMLSAIAKATSGTCCPGERRATGTFFQENAHPEDAAAITEIEENIGRMNIVTELIHALPIHERRVFNRAEAASYVGVSPGHFAKLVLEGKMPAPISTYGRARRWDKAALDHILDGESSNVNATATAYDQWRQGRGQS